MAWPSTNRPLRSTVARNKFMFRPSLTSYVKVHVFVLFRATGFALVLNASLSFSDRLSTKSLVQRHRTSILLYHANFFVIYVIKFILLIQIRRFHHKLLFVGNELRRPHARFHNILIRVYNQSILMYFTPCAQSRSWNTTLDIITY